MVPSNEGLVYEELYANMKHNMDDIESRVQHINKLTDEIENSSLVN